MRTPKTLSVAAGFSLMALGLWGALVPFIGPSFHYGFGPDATWHFTLNRLWLNLLPGAAAIVAGATLVVGEQRRTVTVAGSLALLSGAWFILGPSASLLWSHVGTGLPYSGIGAPLGGRQRSAAEFLGFFYGPGVLATVFSSVAIARLAPPAEQSSPAVERPRPALRIMRRRGGNQRRGDRQTGDDAARTS